MKKGQFIAIYGINNIGKTHHAKRLVERLCKAGRRAVYIKYPVYDLAPTGPMLNKILRSSKKQKISEDELQLLFVLNRYQFQPQLLDLLKRGTTIIAEDYCGTGIAWGRAKGSSLSELENMNKFLVQPDVCILMKGKRKMRSQEKNHIHERDNKLAEKCRKIFSSLGRRYGWRRVSVHENPDVTAERIWAAYRS